MDKQIITFTANEQCLRKTGGLEVFATKTVSYIEAHFDLGDNWSGYDSVRAVWWNDYVRPISTVLDTEGICIVPTEVLLRKGTVYVNLVGSISENDVLTDRLTTIPITALVEKFNAHVDSTETAPITPSQFEQFVSIVQDAVANIKDIVSTTLNADYTLTFVYSDGTSYTTPSIRGERGPQGADGADGTDGNGIASAVLNPNYTLTLTFTDGTSYTTPSIRGAQGPKGDPGDVSQAQLDAAVSDLKSELSDLEDIVFTSTTVINPDWANKAVGGSTGEQIADNAKRCSNTTLIHVLEGGTFSIKPNTTGINVEVYRFVNGSFVGAIDTITTETIYKGDVSIRVLINYTDNSDINVADADTLVTIKITADTLKMSEEMTYTNNMVDGLLPVSGYYNSSKHHNSTSYRYFAAVPVENGKTYNFYPKARFFTVLSGTSVVQAVSDDNITSVTATSDGYAYITYYVSDDISTYKMYESPATDCPPYGKKYLSEDVIVTNASENTNDVLYGKKWVACGDSFTQGAFSGETDPTTFDDDPYYGQLKVYPFFIGRRTGMNVVNEAVGGSTMTDIDGTHQRSPFSYQRYQAIPNDADYITLYFGINDYNYNAPIGSITDSVNTTFYGAWNIVLSWLIANRPKAKIGIVITNGSMENGLQTAYTEAEIAIAKKYGIPYLNLALDDKIPYFCRQWERTDVDDAIKRSRDAYYQVSNTNFHPNVKAHEFESTFIEAWLRTL